MRNFLIRLVVAAGLAGLLASIVPMSYAQFFVVTGMALLLMSGFAVLFRSETDRPHAGSRSPSTIVDYPPDWGHSHDGHHLDGGGDGGGGGGGGDGGGA